MLIPSPRSFFRPVSGLIAMLFVVVAGPRGLAQDTYPIVSGIPFDYEVCRSANTDICFEQHELTPITFDGQPETFVHTTAGEVHVSESVSALGGGQFQVTISFESADGSDLYPAGGEDSSGNPITLAGLGLGHLSSPLQFHDPVRLDSAVFWAHSPLLPGHLPNPFPIEIESATNRAVPWDGAFPGHRLVQLVGSESLPVLGLNVHRVDAVLTMSVIPEPNGGLLGGFGLVGILLSGARRRRRSNRML